jgi:hypothetical protein
MGLISDIFQFSFIAVKVIWFGKVWCRGERFARFFVIHFLWSDRNLDIYFLLNFLGITTSKPLCGVIHKRACLARRLSRMVYFGGQVSIIFVLGLILIDL